MSFKNLSFNVFEVKTIVMWIVVIILDNFFYILAMMANHLRLNH